MTRIGQMFDSLVIDNLNGHIEDMHRNMNLRRLAKEGLSQQEVNWVAGEFVSTWGQAYCDAIYAVAKAVNDNENIENVLTVRINDELPWDFYTLSQMYSDWIPRNVNGYASFSLNTTAWDFCASKFEGSYGTEAADEAAMLMTYVLARTFENSGFFVDVYELDGKWMMKLSWEYGAAEEEPAPDAIGV